MSLSNLSRNFSCIGFQSENLKSNFHVFFLTIRRPLSCSPVCPPSHMERKALRMKLATFPSEVFNVHVCIHFESWSIRLAKNWHKLRKTLPLSCPFPLNFFFLTFTFISLEDLSRLKKARKKKYFHMISISLFLWFVSSGKPKRKSGKINSSRQKHFWQLRLTDLLLGLFLRHNKYKTTWL